MTATATVDATRSRLGRVGVWLLDGFTSGTTPAAEERRQVARVEELGYGSLWFAETVGGKDALAHAAILLEATERLVVGTGIANMRSREPATMQSGALTLAEAYPGRFVLGLGGVTSATRAREYVERMDASLASPASPTFEVREDVETRIRRLMEGGPSEAAVAPPVDVPRVLAALGPRMLAAARDHGDGAHPFSSPVEHTRVARATLGPDKLLIPEQAVVLDTDAGAARERARKYVAMGRRWSSSPYNANLKRLGWRDDEIDPLSDRLVDALVAWGSDEQTIVARVREQLTAGADHVLVHPLTWDLASAVDQLERLAPALLELDRELPLAAT